MGEDAEPVVLSVGLGSDGLGVLLTRGGRAPVHGRLDPGKLGAIRAPAPSPGILLPGADSAFVAGERRVGRALAELFGGAVDRALEQVKARTGARLELFVDAGPLAHLPWELLECAPQDSGAAAGARVVRLVPGAARASARGGAEVWVPVPDDAVCAEVAGALGPLDHLRARVLHVICHGEIRGGEMFLRLGGGRAVDAAGAVAVLRERLREGPIVVLDVCGAGGAVADAGASMSHRLVEAGAAACLAPRCPYDAAASIAASRALYGALAAGSELAAAVDAVRGALAAMGMAHPAFRWWTPVLAVADARSLRRGADALMAEACRLGAVHGFVGVEHIAVACARMAAPPPAVAIERERLLAMGETLGAWSPGPRDAGVTPRVAAMLAELPEDFDTDALLAALARARPVRMAAPFLGRADAAAAGGPTVEAGGPDRPARGGWLLEVLGGPEDGRRIALAPGDVLGRWDPARTERAIELFVEGPFDPAVSRRHLEVTATGALCALAPFTDGGDVLRLGRATRLLVLRRP